MTQASPAVFTMGARLSVSVVNVLIVALALVIGYVIGVYGVQQQAPMGGLSLWVFFAAAILLTLAALMFRKSHSRSFTLLQKCVIASLLGHVLLALILSAIAVSQQIIHLVRHNAMLVPTVNLQLSREMEVRTVMRQPLTQVHALDPTLLKPPEQAESPARAHAMEPLAAADAPHARPAADPMRLNPDPIQIASAVPATGFQLPLIPVRPNMAVVEIVPPRPVPVPADEVRAAAVGAPVDKPLAETHVREGGASGSSGFAGPEAPTGPAAGAAGLLSTPGTSSAGPGIFKPVAGGDVVMREPHLAALPRPVAAVLANSPNESLRHRSYDKRQNLLEKYGGSNETEKAVARSLAFLGRDQETDGRWTYEHGDFGPGNHEPHAHDVGFTGLGTLCYLAADHTPARPGPYQETVRKALQFIQVHQGQNGDLRGGGNMYDHAIGTLALSEAAAMTRDVSLTKAALAGAQFIVSAQNESTGGWRYDPNDRGDTSVFGWQIMALHSAERLGFAMPPQTREGAGKYLDSISTGQEHIYAGYLDKTATRSMTAEAAFGRMLLGQDLSANYIQRVSDYLAAQSPGDGHINYYYWYYGSLALMQVQNDGWRRWNADATQKLLQLQRRDGLMDGSFEPDREWGSRGGRIYATALATLSLEVYYRYLPMYAGERSGYGK